MKNCSLDEKFPGKYSFAVVRSGISNLLCRYRVAEFTTEIFKSGYQRWNPFRKTRSFQTYSWKFSHEKLGFALPRWWVALTCHATLAFNQYSHPFLPLLKLTTKYLFCVCYAWLIWLLVISIRSGNRTGWSAIQGVAITPEFYDTKSYYYHLIVSITKKNTCQEIKIKYNGTYASHQYIISYRSTL